MRPIEWGWRVSCMHPECKRVLTGWGTRGYPPLPIAGVHGSGVLRDWFLSYRQEGEDRPASYTKGHIAYCPEHAAPAIAWLVAMDTWRDARSAIFNQAVTFSERVAAFLDPTDKTARQARYEMMRAWEKENPAPSPPWSKK